MNVFHDEDRVLPGFTEFYLVSLSCFVVLAQSKRTRLLLLFLATCGVVIQACRWIQRPSSVFVGFRCQKKVVPGRGAAFVFFSLRSSTVSRSTNSWNRKETSIQT